MVQRIKRYNKFLNAFLADDNNKSYSRHRDANTCYIIPFHLLISSRPVYDIKNGADLPRLGLGLCSSVAVSVGGVGPGLGFPRLSQCRVSVDAKSLHLQSLIFMSEELSQTFLKSREPGATGSLFRMTCLNILLTLVRTREGSVLRTSCRGWLKEIISRRLSTFSKRKMICKN